MGWADFCGKKEGQWWMVNVKTRVKREKPRTLNSSYNTTRQALENYNNAMDILKKNDFVDCKAMWLAIALEIDQTYEAYWGEAEKMRNFMKPHISWGIPMKAKDTEKYREKWHQTLGEEDILHKLLYKLNVDFSETQIYELVGSILNRPPKNTPLDELRVSLSNTLNEVINIWEQIIEEAQKFDLNENKDKYVHFDYSLPFWINSFRIRMNDYQTMYHYVMRQPEKMILSAERNVELCTGELQNSVIHIARINNLSIY